MLVRALEITATGAPLREVDLPDPVAGPGEIVGEMALFEQGVRTATVRASGEVRALRVDKRTFLSRVHADPSFAYRIVEAMSHRIRALTAEVAHLRERT